MIVRISRTSAPGRQRYGELLITFLLPCGHDPQLPPMRSVGAGVIFKTRLDGYPSRLTGKGNPVKLVHLGRCLVETSFAQCAKPGEPIPFARVARRRVDDAQSESQGETPAELSSPIKR